MIMTRITLFRTKSFYIASLLLTFIFSFSQAQSSYKGLRLGATLGTRVNNFTSDFGSASLDATFRSFALGAGATYLSNRLLFGGEFYQVSGSKTSATESLQLIGSVTTIAIGYCLFERGGFRIESSLGFGLSNNQVISEDKQNTRFQSVYNNQLTLNPGLSFYRKSANNLCFGLKLGYSLGTAGESVWKYQSNDLESSFKSKVDAFSVQLTVGGIVEFVKK
jgi:hypothetical protein